MNTPQQLFDELSFYTLSHGHPRFIHQHAVDAFAVQNASEDTKTIVIVFGLLGLYLFLEKDFTGRQVQLAHMQLAKRRILPPRPALSASRGAITVEDVLAAQPGLARDQAIQQWCESVWLACTDCHKSMRDYLRRHLDIQ